MNNNGNNKIKYILASIGVGLLSFAMLLFGAMSISFLLEEHEIGLSVFMAGITAFSAFGATKLKKYLNTLKSQQPNQQPQNNYNLPQNPPNYFNIPNNNVNNNIYNGIPVNQGNFPYPNNTYNNPQNKYNNPPPFNDNMKKVNLLAVRVMNFTDEYNITREETPEFVKIHIVQTDGRKRGIVKISKYDLSVVYRDLSKGTAIVRTLSEVDEIQQYL